MRLRFLVLAAATLFLASFGAGADAGTGAAPAAAERVVAVGDVHGGITPFVAILERAGVIDAHRKWIGGKTVFVQTGDVTDRGAGVRDALDLLMALEPQAKSAGGRVHVLLGNHEIMNLVGDTRDTTPEILASFGGDNAYRESFGPTGRYGKWLRGKHPIVKIDDSLFLHAGINPDVTTDSVDVLNQNVRDQVARWDEGMRLLVEKEVVKPLTPFPQVIQAADALKMPLADILDSHLFHPQGLMWFRGYNSWTEAEGAPRVAALLKRYKVKRIVSGHSVQPGGKINERFGGGIVLIDTGMLDGQYFPGGQPSALEITGSVVKQIY
jgi:hypothetical protein